MEHLQCCRCASHHTKWFVGIISFIQWDMYNYYHPLIFKYVNWDMGGGTKIWDSSETGFGLRASHSRTHVPKFFPINTLLCSVILLNHTFCWIFTISVLQRMLMKSGRIKLHAQKVVWKDKIYSLEKFTKISQNHTKS